jgi:hypothetical protein
MMCLFFSIQLPFVKGKIVLSFTHKVLGLPSLDYVACMDDAMEGRLDLGMMAAPLQASSKVTS